jgi:hypothetical protein
MPRIALAIAARRTDRSFEVKAPSLNAGCANRLVVAIVTRIPVRDSASLNRPTMRSRSCAGVP